MSERKDPGLKKEILGEKLRRPQMPKERKKLAKCVEEILDLQEDCGMLGMSEIVP